MDTSILMAIASWAAKQLHIGESLEGISRELLDEHLWSPIKKKINTLFHSDNDAEHFIEEICRQAPEYPEEPLRDAERIYMEINETGRCEDMREALLDFFKEQSDLIRQMKESRDRESNIGKPVQILNGNVNKQVVADYINELYM